MLKKVTVQANAAGIAIIAGSKNPDYGYVRVTQMVSTHKNGFLRKNEMSTLISGSMVDLIEEGYQAGQTLEGKIYAVETLEPTNPDNVQQDIKNAGDSGIACTVGGMPIYRKTYYTDDVSATSTLLSHDNGAVIKAHYAAKKAAAVVATEEDAEI